MMRTVGLYSLLKTWRFEQAVQAQESCIMALRLSKPPICPV